MENETITDIGLLALLFFVVFELILWAAKFIIGKIARKYSPAHEYITAEEHERSISELKKSIRDMEKRIDDFSARQVRPANSERPAEPECHKPSAPTEQNTTPHPQTLFLPAPSPDGVFHEAFAAPRIGHTVYQMTTTDGNNGTFIFYDSRDALATAMISISEIVKTVCRIDNSKKSPRNIVNVKEGHVARDGNTWKVTEKATVRFE